MYNLNQMIPDKKYLCGDGYGYDIVTCMGTPTEKEIVEHFGSHTKGTYVKVKFDDGREDIFFEADGYKGNLYIEPR